jgi:hypothetical protein
MISNVVHRSKLVLCCLSILYLLQTSLSFAANQLKNDVGSAHLKASKTEDYQYADNITLEVNNFQQAIKLFKWLDMLLLTRIGEEILSDIQNSPHQLTIIHNDNALLSAGVTGAPMTKNLINGVGENAYIHFYMNMEKHGSNCVLGQNGDYIEYSAIQNLFHELSHARHKMKGTWLYFDSEGQAIREENEFRYQWSQYRLESYSMRDENIENEQVMLRTAKSCSAITTPRINFSVKNNYN